MSQFSVQAGDKRLAACETVEGISAATVDRMLRSGRARIDVAPANALAKPVPVEVEVTGKVPRPEPPKPEDVARAHSDSLRAVFDADKDRGR